MTNVIGILGGSGVYDIDGLSHTSWERIDLGRNLDAILVTAAPPRLPQPLIAQLKVGGRMVVPVGNVVQDLQVITKTADGLEVRNISLVNQHEIA